MKSVCILVGLGDKPSQLAKSVKLVLAKSFNVVSKNPDFYVVVGGDGTLLHYLRQLDYPAEPFLGVDAGSLGFFQEIGVDDLTKLGAQISQNQYSLQKLPLLELSDGKKTISLAFNEFVVERASARAANLAIALDDHKFEKFIGDGLIVSTPQGSTAYAGAAGGAILPYDLDAFQIVPSNPHQSALYKALRQPLVLGRNSRVQIEILEPKHRPARVVSDGHELTVGNLFSIGLGSKSVTMLRTKNYSFYERLSQKLIG